MVRNYVRKTERVKITPAILLKAVLEVKKENKKKSEVADLYNIPYGTLKYHVSKYKDTNPDNIIQEASLSMTTILTPELEDLLASHIQHSAGIFMGLTPSDIRKLAYELAFANVKNGIIVPESWIENEKAGKDWFSGYMKRCTELSIRKPEATSQWRMAGFNPYVVGCFYENLKKVLDKYKFDAADIYNMDESGLSTVHIPVNIVATKGEKQVNGMTTNERGETVTLAATICATGQSLPPFFIFPRKRFHSKFLASAPEGSDGVAHESGWMNKSILLTHHIFHISLEAVQYAKNSGIVLLTIPPHTTHKLQPLDVTVFGPLKTARNTAVSNWVNSHPKEAMAISNIPEILSQITDNVFTENNIQSGFRKTGIWPFNSLIFTTKDFAPSAALDRPFENAASEEEDIQPMDIIETAPQTTKSALVTPAMLRPPIHSKPKKARKNLNSKKGKTKILTDTPEMEEIALMEKEKEEKANNRDTKKNNESINNADNMTNHVSKKKKTCKRKQQDDMENDVIFDSEHVPSKKKRIIKVEDISENILKNTDFNQLANTDEKSDNKLVLEDSNKRKRKRNSKFQDYCLDDDY